MVMGQSNYDKDKKFLWMPASSWTSGDGVRFQTAEAYKTLGQSGVTYDNSGQLVVQNKKTSLSIYADEQNIYYNCR
jgi:hypothetical protein